MPESSQAALPSRAPAPSAAGGDLAVRVLGGVSATRGGAEVDLGGRRQRAVLAVLLAARGAAVAPGRLIDLVWGDEPPPSAVAAVQSYVSHLRRRLEPGRSARGRATILRSAPSGYSVHLPAEAVDAWRFEELVTDAVGATDPVGAAARLRTALALWRGPAFADYAGEPWAEAEATRFGELHALAEDRLFALRLDVERPGLLIPDLEAAVAADPLREERWRLLATALYREHRQGDALSALRRARTVLADELGVDPGPALRELEAQLLDQSPGLLPVAAPAAPRPPAPAVPAPAAAPADDFVDREREVAWADGVLTDAARGRGTVLLLHGPAGIGKTRLLTETRRRAEADGTLVLTGRGSQLEQQFGFGVVRQLFEPLLRGGSGAGLLQGAAEAARAVFDESAPSAERGDGAYTALHGLYWLTADLAAQRPLVLAVDDLQWCDTGSLRFFAYLARRLDGLPVALAATLRTGEEYTDAALIAELRDDPATMVVQPAPLTLAGTDALVRQRLGADADSRFVAACHRTTGGNPLLLRQVLRALEADRVRPDGAHADVVTAIGSRAVASLVLMRLSRLSPEATRTARALAVLGDGAELPGVAALCELPEPAAAEAIAELVRTEMLRDEYPLSFVHPLIRDAVYRDLPVGVRQLQHERAARVLSAGGGSPEQVAAHLLQVPSRGDEWVCDVLRRAATVAVDRGAPESAASYLDRALQEPPPAGERTPMLLQLGTVEAMRDGAAAIRHFTEAYDALPPGPERAELAQVMAQLLIFIGDRGDAARFAHQAASEIHPALTDERQGLIALERIAGYMHALDLDSWQGSVAELDGDGPGARRLAAALAWEIAISSEHRQRAVDLAEFALRDGLLQQHDTGLLWAVAAIVLDLADVDVTDFWTRTWSDALAQGSLFSILAVHLWWGFSSWRAGDLRQADALLQVAAENAAAWGNAVGEPYSDAYRTHVLIELGDLPAARAHLARTRARVRIGDGARLYRFAECRLLLEEGRHSAALALNEQLRDDMPFVRNPIHNEWHRHRSSALQGLGRTAEAREHAQEALRLATVWGAPRGVGSALAHLGRIEGSDGEANLREAVRVLTATTARVELAAAQLALARLLPRTPERRDLLHAAHREAEACAAGALTQQAAQLLTADGEVVHPALSSRLTAFERRIAQMTRAGADDREIAQALFLTPQAVQAAQAEIRARLGGLAGDDLEAALTP